MSLDDKLNEALARGLTHVSLTRIGLDPYQWQASSRWTWSGGYRVRILPDPVAAIDAVLSEQPATAQRPSAPSPVAPEVDLFA